jgi:UDP-GlcNAc:undecaprenyl-phosphate GlcNAc-1-phosphate transferase
VDGQMPGIVAISAIVIGLLGLRFSLADPATLLSVHLSFLIAGACVGFLLYNFAPAKIFPGYGATALYLLLSVTAIMSTSKLATAFLVMGVPMIDGIITVLRRIFSGKSPFLHDNKHLHHILLRFGMTPREIALFYWIVSGILGAAALLLTTKGKAFAIVTLIALIGGALVFLHFALSQDNEKLNTKNS